MSMDSTGKCAACYQCFINSTTGVCTAPTALINYARLYNADSTIMGCASGYYPSTTLVCTAISSSAYPNCAFLNSSNNACAICVANYSLVATTANAVTTYSCATTAPANCAVSNCISCV